MSGPYREVVAPDKFMGSLLAHEVTEVLSELLSRHPRVDVVEHPVADGGEGTVELVLSAGFKPIAVNVTGPLGCSIETKFSMRDHEAVIEAGAAAGLAMLPGKPDPKTAWSVTTYGV